MSDLPIFKTTLMEENERLKSKIDELEKHNLDLANESHSKSEEIEALGVKLNRRALMVANRIRTMFLDYKETDNCDKNYKLLMGALSSQNAEYQAKIDELEKENTELKANVLLLKNAVTSLSATDEMEDEEDIASAWDEANDIVLLTPEESLAQHDKEITEKAVVKFSCYLIDNGEPIPEEQLMVFGSDFLEQLQEQE